MCSISSGVSVKWSSSSMRFTSKIHNRRTARCCRNATLWENLVEQIGTFSQSTAVSKRLKSSFLHADRHNNTALQGDKSGQTKMRTVLTNLVRVQNALSHLPYYTNTPCVDKSGTISFCNNVIKFWHFSITSGRNVATKICLQYSSKMQIVCLWNCCTLQK